MAAVGECERAIEIAFAAQRQFNAAIALEDQAIALERLGQDTGALAAHWQSGRLYSLIDDSRAAELDRQVARLRRERRLPAETRSSQLTWERAEAMRRQAVTAVSSSGA